MEKYSIEPKQEVITDFVNKIIELFRLNEDNSDKAFNFLTEFVTSEIERGNKIKLETFLQKISQNSHAIDQLRNNKGLLDVLYKNQDLLLDNEKLDLCVYYFKQRTNEVSNCWKSKEERILENPIANEEEMEVGTYKESIESQIRDAIFLLRKKGYDTFESGFKSVVDGSQFIGFWKESTRGNIKISESLKNKLEQMNIVLEIKTVISDRDQIILKPNGRIDLHVWKQIWDIVAEELPLLSNSKPKKEVTGAAESFIKNQEKLKRGENAELGMGYYFVEGEVKRMKLEEFRKINYPLDYDI